MKVLNLYWSTSLQDGRKNFGDWLSPVLCEALSGMKIVHARPNKCDLMALGSILAKAKNHLWNRRIDIWGSGLIEDIGTFKSPHRIHAVRGKNTAKAIRNQSVTVVGDPGLLCDMLLSGNVVRHKAHSVGLIPHYVDQNNPLVHEFLSRHPRSRMIDVFSDTLDFIRQVAACEVVLSSSLHGLITADSLGVPNHWMCLSDKVQGANFKFYDYYSIYGFERVCPFLLRPESSEAGVLALAEQYHRPGLSEIKKNLLHAFPFKK
jgi:hypothetical protein